MSALSATVLPANDRPRAREAGLTFGVIPTGRFNAITDVAGVTVGQVTLHDDARGMHTGVTAILPHSGNIFQEKVPAGIFLGNGFGKMTGYPQVAELGNLETPVVLTNTLSVGEALAGVVDWTLSQPGNETVMSVNALVGETNDGRVNDIRARFVKPAHVLEAIRSASAGPVEEGAVGAGSGTVAFGFKAGIGTASRVLPAAAGGWTVGVLVQANFGGILTVKGVEAGLALGGWPREDVLGNPDGSIMMIIATDAPLDARNLKRLATRAFMGMAKTGGIASNGSGDFVIAFSTSESVRVRHDAPRLEREGAALVRNDDMTPLFMAAIEATEEAIINSLFRARDVATCDGKVVRALPLPKILELLDRAGARSPSAFPQE
ncbi:P1 family peptidase [Sutterella sp.]|uniref:DmpA family aminopeptidase n=1 Tax=Sutterella sp. TaxID=1981025 RepID=UPI0026DFEDC6|nr:P1 family peptidase [Sutterella sp.]MDO5531488.1 P1 family peptidase [Sutterella sp.]